VLTIHFVGGYQLALQVASLLRKVSQLAICLFTAICYFYKIHYFGAINKQFKTQHTVVVVAIHWINSP